MGSGSFRPSGAESMAAQTERDVHETRETGTARPVPLACTGHDAPAESLLESRDPRHPPTVVQAAQVQLPHPPLGEEERKPVDRRVRGGAAEAELAGRGRVEERGARELEREARRDGKAINRSD